MAFCKNCGTDIADAKFCYKCGAAASAAGDFAEKMAEAKDTIEHTFKDLNDTPDTTYAYSSDDVDKNKVLCIFAYLSVLVLIPMFAAPKDSEFAKFHSNQGLVLLLCEVLWRVAEGIISFVLGLVLLPLLPGFVFSIISSALGLVDLVFIAFIIIGIVNVAKGRAKELPIIGGIKLLK